MKKSQWTVGSGQWAVMTRVARPAPSTAHCPLPTAYSRPGVTLIELLITMAIMAIISAAILGTASSAMEAARRDRTRVLVTKIGNLITERLASYETRRADVYPAITQAIDTWANDPGLTPADRANRQSPRGQMIADARLLAARELMKMEMPDRGDDIEYYRANPPVVLQAISSPMQGYIRRYTPAQAAERDAAECLYMTVMATTADGEARTLFAKQDIGDTDEDGAPEFIDGWGQAIDWIRWPSGVVSDLQPRDAGGLRVDHDPIDAYRRDLTTITGPAIDAYPTDANFRGTYKDNIRDRLVGTAPLGRKQAFRMVPLIYSKGPDGEPGMVRAKSADVAPLDPYAIFDHNGDAGTVQCQAGEVDPDRAVEVKDNITNHLIEY